MLSIIIPAHNEEALLPRTLAAARSACEALGGAYEIIVVNDASTDRTAEVARKHGTRVIDVDRRQIAAVRNAGAAAARGDWFVFVDADTEVTPDVLAAARAALTSGGAIGGGAGVRFEGEVPLYARIVMLVLVPAFRWTGTAAGCFVYATREAFEQVGGFDETLYASEEVAFSIAMKKCGRFVILRDMVLTSGRKVRQYSPWQILRILLGLTIRLPWRSLRQRKGLEFWYDAPRERSE